MAGAHVEASQSSPEDVVNWARLLNHPHIERQIMAADEIAELINREPCPDEALLCGILLCSNDALEGLTRIVLTADDESRQTACNLLFMLSMSEPDRPFAGTLCSAHKANRAIIGASPGLFSAFVAAIDKGSAPARNSALNALMSISFDNAHNCLLIARTPGMIQVLLQGLHTGADESRDGASGVLCNVIYYNKEAARLVLGCDNVLSMLNGLCKSRDIWSKYLGVSVLEACCHQEHAVPLLRQASAVEALREAMVSVEEDTQDKDLSQTQTMRLAAMMAIARLVDPRELHSLRMSNETLKDGVDALRFSLQGRAWGCPSIVFLPIDCLNSLANVAKCLENCPALLETDILACYSALLSKWIAQRDGHVPAGMCAHRALCSSSSTPRWDAVDDGEQGVEPAAFTPHDVEQGIDEEDVDEGAYEEEVDGDDQNGESSSSDAEEEDGPEEVGEEEDAMHENEIEEAAWEGEGGAADDDTQSHATAHESLPLESMPPAPACQGTQQEPLVVLVSEEVRREEVELAIAAMGSLALLGRQHGSHGSLHAVEDVEAQSDALRVAPDFCRHRVLLPLLLHVGDFSRWRSPDALAASRLDWKAWYMEARSLAVFMALHKRLGQQSSLRVLDDNAISLVLKEACTVELAAACLAHHLYADRLLEGPLTL